MKLKNLKIHYAKKQIGANSTPDDRTQFYDALHFYNFLHKEHSAKEKERTTKYEEKRFRKNFWTFSKNAVNGTIRGSDVQP